MKRILTCSDGSTYAPSIYAHTAWAAKRMEAAVVVLHMLNPHHEKPLKSDYSGSIGFGAKSGLLEELVRLEEANAKLAQKRGQAILDDAKVVLESHGLTHVETMQKHGRISEEISAYERDADLVVMGKRGHNANFEKGHLGSNLERVIRGCHHPVLVASREFKAPANFLLAYDGGKSADKALDYLVSEPLLQGLKCFLVSVGKSGNLPARNQEAAGRLQTAGFEVVSALLEGHPEESLIAYIRQEAVDLVMMGAYGHSQIRQLIVGSTTTRIMRAVRNPILLFR